MNADTPDNTSTVYLRTTVHDQEGMIENVLIVIDEILKHHQSQSIVNKVIVFKFSIHLHNCQRLQNSRQ